jgi:hypothetical protein
LALNGLHGVISQKIELLITAVRISNPTLTEPEYTWKRMGKLRANFHKGASEEDTPSFL